VIVLWLLLLAAAWPADYAAAAQHVVVVFADSSKNTLRTIAGITWGLDQSAPEVEVTQLYIDPENRAAPAKIAEQNPTILVTIGTGATTLADKHFPDLPVVFAKVLNPIESGFLQSWDHPGGHLTGASLDIPVLMQMQKFKAIIPNLQRVGVIYTANTRRLIKEAERATGQLGMSLVSYEVSSARELPEALDSLCKVADGIWTVADEALTSPQFVRYTLLETLRSGRPIMGFSRSFVESGALFCLEPDYKYIGRQAARIATEVLQGASPSEVEATVPDIVYLYLNLKTEQLLNLKVPAELVDVAKETY
jgi:putative ABC transport system substrate-binding protein